MKENNANEMNLEKDKCLPLFPTLAGSVEKSTEPDYLK